jgi:Holliday junction DNA helicase RuvA
MIALLDGRVAVRRADHVVVLCGGVGYRAEVSAETLSHVPAVGKDVLLQTQVITSREGEQTLFGFATEEERDVFLLLIDVQGVGGKSALQILSGGSPRDLLAAVAAGDLARLTAVKGVGKKTAERVIVELRSKIDSLPAEAPSSTIARADDPRLEARDGLVGLGFSVQEAEELLKTAPDDAEPAALIAHALKGVRR